MGTLHTGPSIVKPSGQLLADYIKKDPSCLGETILSQFGEQQPFLFKVLSVNQSLSIQAHPNKVCGMWVQLKILTKVTMITCVF